MHKLKDVSILNVLAVFSRDQNSIDCCSSFLTIDVLLLLHKNADNFVHVNAKENDHHSYGHFSSYLGS